jgi:hypothetical protein
MLYASNELQKGQVFRRRGGLVYYENRVQPDRDCRANCVYRYLLFSESINIISTNIRLMDRSEFLFYWQKYI